MTRDAEVIVVGAGVMGLATARALATSGRDVLTLEQFEPAHDRGSSHGSSRIFRLSYPDAAWVRLAQEALPLWRELEAETGRALLERHGSVDFGDWAANRRALAAAGAPFELLDAAALAERFSLAADAGERALHQADGGIVHAEAALGAFAASAAAAGARLLVRTTVERLEVHGDGVRVRTAAQSFEAGAAVVTAGAWARALLAPVGIELPVTVTRETVTYLTLGRTAGLPSVIDFGAGAEPGYALAAPGIGLKAGLHHAGAPADPDEPGTPDPALVARTEAWVERRFPGAEPTGRAETCLYTSTADERFLLERHRRIVVGSACSGHGFKFAPVVGRRLAALAAEALVG